ncbi:MAG: alpha/beta hydrolase [Candidatus Omnitrophota bacterium]
MIIRFIVYTVIVIIILSVFVKYLEDRSVYFPEKEILASPSVIGLAYEDVSFKTRDGLILNAWFVPADNARNTILLCHGNGGNIGDRLDKIKLLHGLGESVFIFDYRGYGLSEGKPSEKGLYLDAQAAYEYLMISRQVKESRIIVYGESLGSVAALELALKRRPAGIIVEGAFSNAVDMAKIIYPKLPSFLFRNKFDSMRKIVKVSSPVLFFHSRDDEVAPFALGEKLYNASSGSRRFVELSGGHNDAFLESKNIYLKELAEFIRGLP